MTSPTSIAPGQSLTHRAARPQDALWVSLIRMPTPADVEETAAASPNAARMLEQWRTWVTPSEWDGSGDTEDFWEMAARLDAALASQVLDLYLSVAGMPVRHLCFADDEVAVSPGGGTDAAVTSEAGEASPVTGQWLHVADLSDREASSLVGQVVEGRLMHYGPLVRFGSLEMADLNLADNYPRSQWFNCHAGRDVLLAGYFPLAAEEGNRLPAPREKRVEDVMAMFASYGYEEVLVKMVRAKHGLWRVPASTDPAVNREVLLSRLGWALIGVEGSPDTMLVQQVVPMRFEYRVFVVDGRPVTGAGCVEEHTPLHATAGAPFSPLVREHRNYALPASEEDAERLAVAVLPAPGPVEECPDVVDRLVAFAADVAHDLAIDGSPWGRAYVLDVALDDENVPLLIEANGLANAGLYASDPRLVVRALVGDV